MNKLTIITGIIIAVLTLKAYACSTETIIIDGRIINCTTCGSVTNCV